MRISFLAAAVVAVGSFAMPAHAQEAANTIGAAAPFTLPSVANEDAAGIKMPELAFKPGPNDTGNYDKYFYFHRADTDYATAFADIAECDGYARGLQSGDHYVDTPYIYQGTLGGALGSAIGNAIAAAIFGSAEKRRLRRMNLRSCMHFKGYGRYGLSKDLWTEFNFEEGLSGVTEAVRLERLKRQALVASAAKPQGEELGL